MRQWVAGMAMLMAGAIASVPAHAEWLEASTPHFLVYGDVDEATIRAKILSLETFDQALHAMRAMKPETPILANRLRLYLLKDDTAVSDLCRCGAVGYYLAAPSGSVAVMPVKRSDNGLISMEAQVTLFHEHTHHFMFQNFPARYPLWFSEGFAEFNSTAKINPDGSVEIGAPANHRAIELSFMSRAVILAILSNSHRAQGGSEPAIYGGGWLLTHYFMLNSARGAQLNRYLQLVAAGKPGIEAAKESFGDLGKLVDEVLAYLRKPLRGFVISASALPAPDIRIRRLTNGEAAVMPARLRTETGVGTKTAGDVLHQARRLAEPYKTDPSAQAELAEAACDAKDYDACREAADRILAVQPNDVRGLKQRGRAEIGRIEKDKAATPAAWATARAWLVKANHVEPDDAEVLELYYDSYRKAGIEPTNAAVMGLRQALGLVPEATALRWRVGADYLRQGDAKGARGTLAPLAFGEHAGDRQSEASLLLARIDKGEDPVALAKDAWKTIDKPDT